MKLKDQVCSLALAKRLKELGAEQESCFYYDRAGLLYFPQEGKQSYHWYSAYTVAELGEMLPKTARIIHTRGDWWVCDFEDDRFIDKNGNEANVRAKMLIYLLENKLIKIPQ